MQKDKKPGQGNFSIILRMHSFWIAIASICMLILIVVAAELINGNITGTAQGTKPSAKLSDSTKTEFVQIG